MGYDGTIPESLLDQPLYRADAWIATFIERADRDWLDGLPPTVRLELDGLGEVLFCHATPHSDEERVSIFATAERLAAILGQDGADRSRRRAHPPPVRAQRRRAPAGQRRQRRPPVRARPGRVLAAARPGRRPAADGLRPRRRRSAFRAAGYPLADSMLAPVDADAVARRYEEHGERRSTVLHRRP